MFGNKEANRVDDIVIQFLCEVCPRRDCIKCCMYFGTENVGLQDYLHKYFFLINVLFHTICCFLRFIVSLVELQSYVQNVQFTDVSSTYQY